MSSGICERCRAGTGSRRQVLFCELTRDGDTPGEADGRALDPARDRIGDLGGVFRVDLSSPAVGELEELVLTSRRIRPCDGALPDCRGYIGINSAPLMPGGIGCSRG